ncbi:retinoblastoma-like protein 2 isoform X2 [Pseudochaenichthys georgianus]|uniref:retinoblastoma-like protein 2 isoform X2 n=1 Tax=Pseudochaenichthys georgianus TaxID=52239 RepID=UPI0039C38245
MDNRPHGNQGQSMFGPSDRLTAEFRACCRDPTDAIETRLRFMLQTFLQHHKDTNKNKNNHLAEKSCCAAAIWYYRILENILSQEKERLDIKDGSVCAAIGRRQSNHHLQRRTRRWAANDVGATTQLKTLTGRQTATVLLELDLFQRCLVACCLEISLFSSSLPYEFPLLLQVLTLAPYHFIKVIELVLRAERCLPRDVVTHLAQSEERVLESLAWTTDSPLWKAISANEGHLPTCQQVMPPARIEGQNQTDFQPDRNPPGDMSVEFSFGAEASSNTETRPPRSNSLHLFARKVYMLMGKRLEKLCSTLGISEELRLKIWTCFEHSLVHFTDLTKDRHLDQLLMCAIYMIAKITNVKMSFKHIIHCYESQPLASRSVCKSVLISGQDTETLLNGNNNNGHPAHGFPTPDSPLSHYPPAQEERVNLIRFYDNIYTGKMHDCADQFDPASGRDTPPLSPYPCQGRGGRASRQSQQVSSSLLIFNSETPGDREEGEDEDGPPAQRLRVAESFLQRRLRSIANDREAQRDRDQLSMSQPDLH